MCQAVINMMRFKNFILFMLITAMALFIKGSTVNAQQTVSLSITPAIQSVGINQSFTADITLNAAGLDISGVDLTIDFDKTKLTVEGFDPDASGGLGSTITPVNVETSNSTGTITYAAGQPATSNQSPSNIRIGTIRFKSGGSTGSVSLTLSYAKITASGQFSALSNVQKTGATINIGTSSSPSPSPQGGLPYFGFDPLSGDKPLGQSFPVTLKLFAADDQITAVDVTLNFNNSKLAVAGIIPNTASGLTDVDINQRVTNSTWRYAVRRSGNRVNISSGAIDVATITFNPIEAGSAEVSYSAAQISSGTSPGVPPTIGANQRATYTITGTAASPSPSPSPLPSPSISPSPSVSPSPLPKVVSMEFDATDIPFATRGEDVTLPIKINTAITGTIYNVTALDTTIKYDRTKFDYVSLLVDPNSGFNANCSRTGQGAGTFCLVLPINSNGTIRLSTAVSTIGAVIAGDPIIARLKLKPKKVSAASKDPANPDIDFQTAQMTGGAQGIASGPLGVETRALNMEIREASFTREYQVCEVNGDVDVDQVPTSTDSRCKPAKPYKNFRNTGKVIEKDYEFQDKNPGLRTIFVRFTSTGNIERVERVLVNFQPNPKIESISCNFTGEGMDATIFGTNFYNRAGGSGVKINGQQADIIEWTDQNVVLPSNAPGAPSSVSGPISPPSGGGGPGLKLWKVRAKIARQSKDNVPVELKSSTNITITSSCQVGVTTLDVSLQAKCGPLPNIPKEEVDVAVYENVSETTALVKSRVKLDSKGKPQTLAPSLQKDKDYVIVVKAPRTLSRKIEFKARGTGTTVLDIIDLPIGNIAPAAAPDSRINSFDRAELVRQWSLTADVVRTGDFNEDSRVNSIDWACMRENFNKDDEIFSGAR